MARCPDVARSGRVEQHSRDLGRKGVHTMAERNSDIAQALEGIAGALEQAVHDMPSLNQHTVDHLIGTNEEREAMPNHYHGASGVFRGWANAIRDTGIVYSHDELEELEAGLRSMLRSIHKSTRPLVIVEPPG
jgi:CTP:molybdopterin cytidylyltransferase MocA